MFPRSTVTREFEVHAESGPVRAVDLLCTDSKEEGPVARVAFLEDSKASIVMTL